MRNTKNRCMLDTRGMEELQRKNRLYFGLTTHSGPRNSGFENMDRARSSRGAQNSWSDDVGMQESHEKCRGPRAPDTDGETERKGAFDTRTQKTEQTDLEKTQTLEKEKRERTLKRAEHHGRAPPSPDKLLERG